MNETQREQLDEILGSGENGVDKATAKSILVSVEDEIGELNGSEPQMPIQMPEMKDISAPKIRPKTEYDSIHDAENGTNNSSKTNEQHENDDEIMRDVDLAMYNQKERRRIELERKGKRDYQRATAEADKEMLEAGHTGLKRAGHEAYVEVKARARTLYEFNRYSIVLFIFIFIRFAFDIVSAVTFITQNVPPRYVAVDNQMRYFSPIPLSIHSKSDADIQSYVITNMSNLFSYDYVNYQNQLERNQDIFTGNGWLTFLDSMQKSFLVRTVVEKRLISTYHNVNMPKIIQRGVETRDGQKIAYWWVETVGQINYVGERNSNNQVRIRLKIERVSTLIKEDGIGISQLLMRNMTN